MEKAPTHTEHEPLRGAETLSPELASVLREAVQKFTVAYKIRQAAGYDYKPSTAVDGNFALRMQYGQLREEIKRLGRRHDAGEELDEDDYRSLAKKQAAFDRSYEKVLSYAEEHGIAVPDVSDVAATSPTTTGEESANTVPEGATIIEPMKATSESPARSLEQRPQLQADMAESESLPTTSETASTQAETEAVTTTEAGFSPEVAQQLLTTLAAHQETIEGFRDILTDTAVESHPAYNNFTKRVQKVRSLLQGEWHESDTIVTQLVKTEQPHIDALYNEIKTDLEQQRKKFEASFGSDMAAVRDEMVADTVAGGASSETSTAKKTGWFHADYRAAQQGGTNPAELETVAEEPYQLTPDARVDTITNQPDIGEYVDNQNAVPEFRQDWQTVSEAVAAEKDSDQASIGDYPTDPATVPDFVQPWQTTESVSVGTDAQAEHTTENAEISVQMFGQELPPSGAGHDAALADLKNAVGKMLLVMDKKAPGQQKRAVHDAWSVLYSVTPQQGLSPEQRQRLVQLATEVPAVSAKEAADEVKVWQEMYDKVPALSEKMQTADEATKATWRQRGKRILLAALLSFAATPTADEDPSNPRFQAAGLDAAAAAPVTPDIDSTEATLSGVRDEASFSTIPAAARTNPHPLEAHTDAGVVDTGPDATEGLSTEKFGKYQTHHTNSGVGLDTDRTLTSQNIRRTAPEAPTQGPGRVYEQSNPDTDNFGKGAEVTAETAPAVTDMTYDQRPVTFETPTGPTAPKAPEADIAPDVSNLISFFERPVLSHTFSEGSSIDTVSEAVWDAWQKYAHRNEVESPLSKSEFINAMYQVIRDIEKNPDVHRALTEQMHISSGNIHRVQVGETINLAPFLAKVRANANAVFV